MNGEMLWAVPPHPRLKLLFKLFLLPQVSEDEYQLVQSVSPSTEVATSHNAETSVSIVLKADSFPTGVSSTSGGGEGQLPGVVVS